MRPSALSSACRGARPKARFHPSQERWLVLRTGHNKGREGDFTLFDPRKALKAGSRSSARLTKRLMSVVKWMHRAGAALHKNIR